MEGESRSNPAALAGKRADITSLRYRRAAVKPKPQVSPPQNNNAMRQLESPHRVYRVGSYRVCLVMDAGGEAVAAQVAGEAVGVAVFMEMPHPRVGARVDYVVMIAAMHHAGRSADATDEPGDVVRGVVIVDVAGDPAVQRIIDVDFVVAMVAVLVSMRRSGDDGGRSGGDEAQSDNGGTERGELEHGEAP